jgi:hypothetical protein
MGKFLVFRLRLFPSLGLTTIGIITLIAVLFFSETTSHDFRGFAAVTSSAGAKAYAETNSSPLLRRLLLHADELVGNVQNQSIIRYTEV